MVNYIQTWFDRHFSDPQVVILALVLLIGLALAVFAARLLAPLIAAVLRAWPSPEEHASPYAATTRR